MAACDVVVFGASPDDGGDVRERRARAVARKARCRQRSRLVRRAARRRGLQGARGTRSRSSGWTAALELLLGQPGRAGRDGGRAARELRRSVSTGWSGSPTSTLPRSKRRPAGPRWRARSVVAEVAAAAADVGIEPGSEEAVELAARLREARVGESSPAAALRAPARPVGRRGGPGPGSAASSSCSTVVRYGLGRRVIAPWIFVDEIIYSESSRRASQRRGRVRHSGASRTAAATASSIRS